MAFVSSRRCTTGLHPHASSQCGRLTLRAANAVPPRKAGLLSISGLHSPDDLLCSVAGAVEASNALMACSLVPGIHAAIQVQSVEEELISIQRVARYVQDFHSLGDWRAAATQAAELAYQSLKQLHGSAALEALLGATEQVLASLPLPDKAEEQQELGRWKAVLHRMHCAWIRGCQAAQTGPQEVAAAQRAEHQCSEAVRTLQHAPEAAPRLVLTAQQASLLSPFLSPAVLHPLAPAGSPINLTSSLEPATDGMQQLGARPWEQQHSTDAAMASCSGPAGLPAGLFISTWDSLPPPHSIEEEAMRVALQRCGLQPKVLHLCEGHELALWTLDCASDTAVQEMLAGSGTELWVLQATQQALTVLLREHPNADVRREVFQSALKPLLAALQEALQELARLRNSCARSQGWPSHSSSVLHDSMFGSEHAAAEAFLKQFGAALQPMVNSQLLQLSQRAARLAHSTGGWQQAQPDPWSIDYLLRLHLEQQQAGEALGRGVRRQVALASMGWSQFVDYFPLGAVLQLCRLAWRTVEPTLCLACCSAWLHQGADHCLTLSLGLRLLPLALTTEDHAAVGADSKLLRFQVVTDGPTDPPMGVLYVHLHRNQAEAPFTTWLGTCPEPPSLRLDQQPLVQSQPQPRQQPKYTLECEGLPVVLIRLPLPPVADGDMGILMQDWELVHGSSPSSTSAWHLQQRLSEPSFLSALSHEVNKY